MASGTTSTAFLLLLFLLAFSASATVAVSDLPDGKAEFPADSDPTVANLAASYIPVKFIHVRLDGRVVEQTDGHRIITFLRRQSSGGPGRKLLHLRKLSDLGADDLQVKEKKLVVSVRKMGADELQGKERKLVVNVRRMGPDCSGTGGGGGGMMGGRGGMMGGGGGGGMMGGGGGGGGGMMGGGGGEGGGNGGGSARRFSILTDRQ